MHKETPGTALPSVMALAFLGDARHSLYVRKMLIRRGYEKSGELNREALGYVTAEAQAALLRRIEPLLLDDEHAVYKRASNSTHLNRPKHASVADYRAATGLEAVIGMLVWLGDEERIEELLSYSDPEKELPALAKTDE